MNEEVTAAPALVTSLEPRLKKKTAPLVPRFLLTQKGNRKWGDKLPPNLLFRRDLHKNRELVAGMNSQTFLDRRSSPGT